MKFTLKEYQDEAVRDVLVNLRKARKRWREDSDQQAFSLTAATGAGKTVMAAAAFEALFHGDDNYEFDADHSAVVIWFSDDPSLNEQTRFRLMESSDRLRHTDLVVVENTFNRAKFEPGKIYFLNTQKLGKKSLLVRGFDNEDNSGLFPETRPDMRAFTIWDTIRNTIEDPTLTLYLVLDEAHRGMGDTSSVTTTEKSTIVKRLINGEKGVPAIPIVLGISATVERFNKAMEVAQSRSRLPDVKVDVTRVQDSGLLKDTISLDIPDEAGKFDTVLMRLATDKLKESTAEWDAYAKQQGNGESVVPLMVLQLPNTPSANEVGKLLEAMFQHWTDLPETCVAHVLGEHSTQTYGNYKVPYISPEHVQDHTSVRVLIAKDAISTGWDCPRAEVMISFRAATDYTHITQLLGRMVRTPLARRIPGNDRLNSVDCILPFFNETAVKAVVKSLTQGGGDSPPFGRVLINPVEMKPNPSATDAIWTKFDSLPSQTRPQRSAKPAIRLTALAHELAFDGILTGAGNKAHAELHKLLDEQIESRAEEFDTHRKAVLTVEGRTILADIRSGEFQSSTFKSVSDDDVVDDAYRRSARIFSPDIARTYTVVLAKRKENADDDFDAALIEAREDIAALGLLANVQIIFDAEAEKLSNKWLIEFQDQIKKLSDDRQDAYRQIISLSKEPQDISLTRPVSWLEATAARDPDGNEVKLPTHKNHLICDENGLYPAEFNPWEEKVLSSEMKHTGFKFWYRNPNRPSQDSLGISYKFGDEVKIVRPDFLFFSELPDGTVIIDIVDPHSTHLADALSKLQGLVAYAESHPGIFRRIEAVSESGGKLRALNLMSDSVRQAIAVSTDAASLYKSTLATDYK
jgi:hypothetical protein